MDDTLAYLLIQTSRGTDVVWGTSQQTASQSRLARLAMHGWIPVEPVVKINSSLSTQDLHDIRFIFGNMPRSQ